MKIHHLSEKNSVLNHFLGEIRDVNIQKDRLRFRRNIERIGEIMAYEISKDLHYKNWAITTPLGVKNSTEISDKIVICSILRAGLTLHNGFLNYFDGAENGGQAGFSAVGHDTRHNKCGAAWSSQNLWTKSRSL